VFCREEWGDAESQKWEAKQIGVSPITYVNLGQNVSSTPGLCSELENQRLL